MGATGDKANSFSTCSATKYLRFSENKAAIGGGSGAFGREKRDFLKSNSYAKNGRMPTSGCSAEDFRLL